MMAYCTTAQVQAILENVDGLRRDYETDLTAQIALAEYEINAELEAAGYTTPLASPPQFVALATANLTAYLVVRRVNTNGAFTDIMREFRQQADRFLSRLRDGAAVIPQDALPKDDAYTPLPSVVNPHAS